MGSRAWGFGFGVSVFGFHVSGSRFRVSGFGFRDSGVAFRVRFANEKGVFLYH